ncbi:hypothetical protein HYW75_05840 [Candidatus Pacearchaeota archaeon]|nr:hypothetical protein [Candidatus Pacearchaeota archaeon]
MTYLYLTYRKREIDRDIIEISILASGEKIGKDSAYSVNIPLNLKTVLKPETAINQLKSSIFGNPEGARGLKDKDRVIISDSEIENELRFQVPKDLASTIFDVYTEYVLQQLREKDYDHLSER